MIVISGLIPDFSNEVTEVKQSDVILEFSYENSLEEIDGAMKTFQQKFSGKKHKIMLFAYIILTIAAVVLVIFDHTNILPYIALVFCGFNLYYNLTDRKRMRKKVIEAIKDTNPEDYTAKLYEDKIEIVTVIKPKENEEASEEEGQFKPVKSVFIFGEDMLDFAENEDSLLLIVARRQTYCFPKRFLDPAQQELLRSTLKEKTEM